MNEMLKHRRWLASVLIAAMSVAILAPTADAGHKGRRYKGSGNRGGDYRETGVVRQVYAPVRTVRYVRSPHSTYVVRRSSAGPVIAGFLGGLFLGAAIANAAPVGYEYYDSYCDESFATLEIYHSHLRHHRHPRIVRVIEADSGHCVRSYRYDDGSWEGYDQEGDWDH
jgi:hypothetical protein